MNTTENVVPTHVHAFSAQGLCSCGLTHDQYRLAEEAKNAPVQPEQAAEETPQEAEDEEARQAG